MARVVLVTGATGFLGAALVLELLRNGETEVVCLVRRRGSERPSERMREALELACRCYGEQALLDEIQRRCSVLEGDVTQAECGVSRAARRRIDEVWHCAALLAFDREREDEVHLTNVVGSRHVLELAGDLGATACNHISTAYVGGARAGVLREELAPPGAPCGNAYELSKLKAEHLVAGAGFERTRIFRPSILVEHSATGAAAGTTGPARLIGDLCDRIEGLREHLTGRSLRLGVDPRAPFDCVAVDWAAGAAVTISRSDSPELIFHLTSAAPRTLTGAADAAAKRAGISTPTLGATTAAPAPLDRRVEEALAPYRSYLAGAKEFDRTNAEAVLGPDRERVAPAEVP